MIEPMPPFRPEVDWTYSEGCGCRTTFYGATFHKTSQMTACTNHDRREQMTWRDRFMDRARDAKRFAEAAGPPL
jgi:hypothetical protein